MIEEQIFPLITLDGDKIKCMGTGFFIEAGGGFVTAKHVIHVPDKPEEFKMWGVQSLSNGSRLLRKVIHFHAHPDADIAIGRLGGITDENDEPVNIVVPPVSTHQISLDGFKIGDKISSFGYPNVEYNRTSAGVYEIDFMGEWTYGEVLEYWARSIWIPTPCFQTNMPLKQGHSGGPVLNDGHIVGVNNSGNDETSFVSSLTYLLDLNIFVNGQTIKFRELVKQGGTHHFKNKV